MSGGRRVGGLVVGGNFNGLGVVRSLGRRGIPAVVIDYEPFIARHSRYATSAELIPELKDPSRIVATLLDVGRRLGLEGWVIFPTGDDVVAAVSRGRDVLGDFYRVPTPDWNSVRYAWDKRLTYELAASLDIPVPKTEYGSSPEELASNGLVPPVVVKPAIKDHFLAVTKVKAWRADSREDARTLARRAAEIIPADEVMLQELIPGGGDGEFGYCAFYRNGSVIASMTVRRRRQYPIDFGRSSTYVETVVVPEVAEMSARFLAACGYYGLVELEYKRDPRDSGYRLLDVNPRTWGYHSLGARAGVDFPVLLYEDQVGEPAPAPAHAAAGVRWVHLTADILSGMTLISDRRMRVTEYIRSLLASNTDAVFCRDDPRPGFAEVSLLPYLYSARARGRIGAIR
jgi:predicted ATP-grasp superfamily ATP-dependent carboligase